MFHTSNNCIKFDLAENPMRVFHSQEWKKGAHKYQHDKLISLPSCQYWLWCEYDKGNFLPFALLKENNLRLCIITVVDVLCGL